MALQANNEWSFYLRARKKKITNESVLDYCLISTVGDNEKQFHRREVEAAQKAGKIIPFTWQAVSSNIPEYHFNNLIQNCPVTIEDVNRYFDIYGSDVATLQGKTKKCTSSRSVASLPCPLPPSILQHHRHVALCIDIFYVQGLHFFHSISSKIHFRTATQLTNRSKRSLL